MKKKKGFIYMGEIQTKRSYEEVKLSDGKRVLVDRIWPRCDC